MKAITPTAVHSKGATPESQAQQMQVQQMVELVREISLQTDPQEMVSVFRRRMPVLYGGESHVSLSRRGLSAPTFKITRSTRWAESINPWKEPQRIPVFRGGVLAELLYGDEPRVVADFEPTANDPAYEYIRDARSLVALPMYDGGVALNMVIRMSPIPGGFDCINLPDAILTANLFGRATNNLVIAQRLAQAYAELDHEMRRVAALQRSLLPEKLPQIPTLDIAAWYKTAARAGGDYYDFFDIGDGRWGLWLADVSGHGTPAAVMMAMLRTMLHARCNQAADPHDLLRLVNRHLCDQSARYGGMFTTAFYGLYDPRNKSLRYCCAGHNPPLLVDRKTSVMELDEAQTLPLGVEPLCEFPVGQTTLAIGDTLMLYTDGITEASNPGGEFYGRERLLSCVCEDAPNAQHIIDCVTSKLLGFMDSGSQVDDQTLVAMRVR